MEELREYLDYDPITGDVWWKKRPCVRGGKAGVGDICDTINREGYKKLAFRYKTYLVHRVIFYLHYGYVPDYLDHKNCIKTDNRVENLRPALQSENCQNIAATKKNTSGFKGVSWHPHVNMWSVRISQNKKRYSIGYFKDKLMAARAYNKKALELHGEFARLNEIPNG